MFYEDLNSLFKTVLDSDQTLVYGDLGRLPHIVVQHLSSHHAHLKVMFVSFYYPVSFPNHLQFRNIQHKDIHESKCDLLVFIEPSAHSIIKHNYPSAGSTLILTSHAVLDLLNPSIRHAIYFHNAGGGGSFDWSQRIDRIRQLISKLEGSEENENVHVVKHHISHPSVVTIGRGSHSDITLFPGKCAELPDNSHFVIVDLTDISITTGIFLYFWDAFDYMATHLDRVERWSVCFGRQRKVRYDNFVQECIDRLHCSPIFQKHLKRILPLLPFYKSGTIDKNFEDIEISRFIRHEYVAPETIEDAFKMAIAFDTKQLVGGVFSIIK